MNKPLHLLSGIQSFTIDKLEKKLSEEETLFFNNKKWNNKAKENGVFFDLSQVIWVNISAAFQLCLLVENAKKNNIQVYVSLPIRVLTTAEEESSSYSESIKTTIKNSRQKANDFLKVIQFDNAILCNHISNDNDVKVSEDYQFSREFNFTHFKSVFSTSNSLYTPLSEYHDFNYKYIVPLTWLHQENNSFQEISEKIESILIDENRGLHHLDILSLKNVILYELLKNIREHTGDKTEHALFCIGLINSKSITTSNLEKKVITHSNNIEQDFLEGIIKSDINSVVEIYFGDSGDGLLSNDLKEKFNQKHLTGSSINNIDDPTNQYKLIKWSFDKWSTRKDEKIRGTKGLYRIQRIVNKYNGIIHLRTGRVNGGYQKGGKPESTWVTTPQKNLFHQPGTLINIKLSPYKEILKYNLQTNRSIHKKKWQSLIYEIEAEKDDTPELFIQWINNQSNFESFDNTVIIFKSNKNTSDDIIVKFLEDCLKFLSEFRHPLGVLVYIAINLGKETLRSLVESTNDLIIREIGDSKHPESEKPHSETVYDPVLVLGEDNSLFWYGGNQKIIDILNEIYNESEQPKKIKNLTVFKNLSPSNQNEVLMFFQNDSNFFFIDKNESLYFNFTNLKSLFSDILSDSVENGRIEYEDKAVCSPKLDIGKNWLNMKTILNQNNSTGFALVLYILLSENQFIKNLYEKKKTYLFIDHNQQYLLAKELARIMGLSYKNIVDLTEDIDLELPRRTKLFNRNDNVIILTTLISSSETIRRLVKHIQRDKANPICILCLLNNRKYKIDTLKTWKQKTKIISLSQKYNEDKKTPKPSKSKQLEKLFVDLQNDIVVYSPNYELVKDRKRDIEFSDELSNLFKRTNCLHYDHLGKYNDRHYTFYLDKDKILNDPLIIRKIQESIESWVNLNNVDKFTVLIPEKNNKPILKCLQALNNFFKINEIIKINEYKADEKISENALFIDFGSLTGSTLNKVIASNPASKNLLMLTLFSQFKEEKNKFYKKIKSTQVDYTIASNENNQISIFDDLNEVQLIDRTINISVSFEFLFDLPIYFYHSIHCPICQHNEALDSFQLNNVEYMKAFSKDRKDRLKIKSYDILPKVPVDFYCSTNSITHHEISSSLIIGMYELKQLLENAKINTEHRVQLFNKLYNLYTNYEDEIKNPDSFVYSILYFLSHEVIWMQKEPLIYQNFRYLLEYFSKQVAVLELSELVAFFEKKYKNIERSRKVATRFKYSAISVLRSSNKYEYCKNVFSIIKSSRDEQSISNNLLQNCLYHINSLHLNKYNNSIEFYIELENQFKKLDASKIIFTNTQKNALQAQNAIQTIRLNNQKLIKQSEIYDLNSQLDLFKKLKKDVNEIYEVENNHPWPISSFDEIKLDKDEDTLRDALIFGEDSISYEEFYEHIQSIISNKYEITKSYIETIVMPTIDKIEKLEKNVFNSETFTTFYTQLNNYRNSLNSFEDLIREASTDIISVLRKIKTYNIHYNTINSTFIKNSEQKEWNSSNAELLNILYEIPTSLNTVIKNIFDNKGFKSVKYNLVDEDVIFYSKNSLSRFLILIYQNIQKYNNEKGLYYDLKSYEDVKVNNINISFSSKVDDDSLILTILNDGTHLNTKEPNPKGNLFLFNRDLSYYNGELNHKLNNEEFKIEIKFKLYETN